MPLIRKLVWSSGYGEGWGLYAEQLADELGAYEDDPVGRIGFVWSALLRASRLVVDTGIHAFRWSREEAIAWLVDHGGIPKGMATNEVERSDENTSELQSLMRISYDVFCLKKKK